MFLLVWIFGILPVFSAAAEWISCLHFFVCHIGWSARWLSQTVLVFIFVKLAHNGLAVGEEADFEALNCLPALNLIRRTNLHLCTEPAFLPNACYMPFILSMRNYRSYKCSQCPNNSVSNNYFFVSQRVSKKNKKANVNR